MASVHHGFAGLARSTLQRDLGSRRDFCGTTEGGVAGRAHWRSCFLFHGRCSWNVGNGLFQQLIYYYLLLDINDTFGQMPTYHGMLFCFFRTKVKHRRRSYETWANCPLSFWQRRRLVWRWTNFPRRTFLLKNWNKKSFPLVKNRVRTPINGLIL